MTDPDTISDPNDDLDNVMLIPIIDVDEKHLLEFTSDYDKDDLYFSDEESQDLLGYADDFPRDDDLDLDAETCLDDVWMDWESEDILDTELIEKEDGSVSSPDREDSIPCDVIEDELLWSPDLSDVSEAVTPPTQGFVSLFGIEPSKTLDECSTLGDERSVSPTNAECRLLRS